VTESPFFVFFSAPADRLAKEGVSLQGGGGNYAGGQAGKGGGFLTGRRRKLLYVPNHFSGSSGKEEGFPYRP
jgi:hypothetical protein